MIVISGALVLVALVLLVIGLVDPSLAFVYASIGVSLASFAFLVVGILQRRKEELPGAEAAAEIPTPATAEGITAILAAPPPRPAARNALADEPAAAPVAAQREAVSGTVLVVAGRPRYHVDGCRYLTGKDAEEVEVADAREEGFTACGVCKPDLALEAAQPTSEPAEEPVAQTAEVAEVTETPEVEVVAPVTTRGSAAKKAPARAATAKAPAKAAVKAATTAATKAPAKAATTTAKAATPAKKAAATPARRGTVVVIPDRGKYHTPDCRYVRGAEGTLELTKAQATKQGYDACGVCNP